MLERHGPGTYAAGKGDSDEMVTSRIWLIIDPKKKRIWLIYYFTY